MDDGARGYGPVLASSRLFCALLAVVVVLGLVSAFAWHRSGEPDETAAPRGAISSVTARDAALRVVAPLTRRVLSYDWKTLEADMKAAEALLAPSFRSQYAVGMNRVKAQTVTNQVRLSAAVATTSIVSASTTRVVALVFVDQTTTAKGSTSPRLDQTRIRVTLSRHVGEWRISRMEAF